MYIVWDEYYNQRYTLNRSMRGKGNGPWNHKHAKDFERIAKHCLSNNVDPRRYVEITFRLLSHSGKNFITPKDLTTKSIRAEANLHLLSGSCIAGNFEDIWKESMKAAKLLSLRAPKFYPDVYSVLKNPNTGFDSWFRVMAFEPLDDELCSIYGSAAYDGISKNRNLRNFLRKHVPNNFIAFERRYGSFGGL